MCGDARRRRNQHRRRRTGHQSRAGDGKPALRGIHHLAIVTEDMRGTLDFYVRVLGLPLVHALTTSSNVNSTHGKGAPPFKGIPHLFLDMGGDSLLAFFEYPRGAVGAADRDRLGAMQHVSLVSTSGMSGDASCVNFRSARVITARKVRLRSSSARTLCIGWISGSL